MAEINDKWGNSIRDLLSKHGLSPRAARIKCGGVVSHTTIIDWMNGVVPQALNDKVYPFFACFLRQEAVECLLAGGLPVPDAWKYHHEINIDIPGVGDVIIRAIRSEFTPAETSEIIQAVTKAIQQ